MDRIEQVVEILDECAGVRSCDTGLGRVGRGTLRGSGREGVQEYLGIVSVKVWTDRRPNILEMCGLVRENPAFRDMNAQVQGLMTRTPHSPPVPGNYREADPVSRPMSCKRVRVRNAI